jgi:uncharacterized protein (DUF433 family)
MKLSVINIDPEILGGTPVFRGTRVPIQALFDHLIFSTLEEFLYGYPTISRKMINEVLEIAAFNIRQKSKNPFEFLSSEERIELLKKQFPPDQILFL